MIASNEAVFKKLGVDCTIVRTDGSTGYLNASLVLSRNITRSDILLLKHLHAEKYDYFSRMRDTDDSVELREYADHITNIEYAMQSAWNFPQNQDFHEWYLVPKCTCPKMDNAERRGTPYGIVSGDCPIHGFKVE